MSLIPITWAGSPRWWHAGRDVNGPISYVVVHDTEGHEGPDTAEAGIAYDKTRSDSVSCHVFVDTNSAPREVQDVDTAYAAMPRGNALGIQVELCHAGPWDLREPNDAATFDNGAQVVAQLCLAHGIPAVHLSVAQTRAAWFGPGSPRGIVGHADVTLAYPEDQGDHTDPGPTFPWPEFIARVAGYMGGQPVTGGDDDMRYVFSDKWGAQRPGNLGTHPVRTDGLGRFWQEPFSMPGQPAAVTIDPANNWDFGRMFSELTGGCVMTADAAGNAAKFGVNPAMFPAVPADGGDGPAPTPGPAVQFVLTGTFSGEATPSA